MNALFKRMVFAAIAIVLTLAPDCQSQNIPPPPPADYPVIDNLSYPDAASARTAWKPVTGNAPAALHQGSCQTLLLPCNFKNTSIPRASWDHALALDLTNRPGLQFQFYCPDATPVSRFNIYLQSGNGWYSAEFGQTTLTSWTTAVIQKSEMNPEQSPAGWGAITRIRISAWRGKNEDAEIHMANLGFIPAAKAGNTPRRPQFPILSPREDEKRLIWCHNPFGPKGKNWDAAIRDLADTGFTGIIVNMCWGGTAYYDSNVLPLAPSARNKGDQITQCLAACRKYGMECHIWKVCWNMENSETPAEFLEQVKSQNRAQVDYYGNSYGKWLCPSDPRNQQLEINAMVELAAKYEIDGIHFDYIRYPGPDHCFCAGCRSRFEQSIGHPVANWPSDTRTNATIQQKWLDWRRGNINNVVSSVHTQVRATKPKMKISAAVFPKLLVDRDEVAQDWKAWCDQGYMDFVCPMDYTPFLPQFENLAAQQRAWAGNTRCYPGIGLSVWKKRGDADSLMDFINATRRRGTNGFTVFQYDDSHVPGILPFCQTLFARKPALRDDTLPHTP